MKIVLKCGLQITGFGYSNEHGTGTCQDLAIYIVSGAIVRSMICIVCVLKVNIEFEFEMLFIIIFNNSVINIYLYLLERSCFEQK